MEKFKTKNLILASFIALAMMFVAMFGFAACGKGDKTVELKAADLVGDWYTFSASYTEEGSTAENYTYEQFTTLHEQTQEQREAAGTNNDYLNMIQHYFFKFKITEDGNKIQCAIYTNEDNYFDIGTWAIAENKLTVDINAATFGANTVTAEYKDGKIVVTATGDDFVTVITLAKVVAE